MNISVKMHWKVLMKIFHNFSDFDLEFFQTATLTFARPSRTFEFPNKGSLKVFDAMISKRYIMLPKFKNTDFVQQKGNSTFRQINEDYCKMDMVTLLFQGHFGVQMFATATPALNLEIKFNAFSAVDYLL